MYYSVCSNVPTYTEPICFVSEGDTSEMVEFCLQYLTDISEKLFAYWCQAMEWYLKKFNKD
jgi:hypothetical protein